MRTSLTRRRAAATAAVALGIILASRSNDTSLIVPVSGQQIERAPGPIIEDPPGVFTGETSFVPMSRVVVPGAALSTFIVTYNGFSPQAQAAFQAAVNVWASQIQSSVPIRVTANWTVLSPGVLGSAGPSYIFRNFAGAPSPNTWYGAALAKKLSGSDLTAGLADPSDIVANFNSSFSWYYGIDGNPGAQFDLMTVVLHELGHALGFFGSMTASGGVGSWGFSGSPVVYDSLAINGSYQPLTNTTIFPNPSTVLGSQLVSNNLFFNGTTAKLANGGIPPRLYAPATWSQGSSFSHLDETAYPQGNANSLMTPALAPGEAIHDVGAIVRGLFMDIGWTVASLRRTRGDVDGDGRSDVGIYRAGVWHTLLSGSNFTTSLSHPWGLSTDIPVQADYDGDGRADRAIYRPSAGVWYVLNSRTNFATYSSRGWGTSTDVPVPADYDGDGIADFAVYRPSVGTWFILLSSTNSVSYVSYGWGVSTDTPLGADFDGDGKADLAIFRNGAWLILRSMTNFTGYLSIPWGTTGDVPVPADYDGDGREDPAVYRPSGGVWYVLLSSTNYASYLTRTWGVSTDVPGSGDYDGDGRADMAIYRGGGWYVLLSSGNWNTYSTFSWGIGSDVPLNTKP
jgi:hypothetical protein